MPPLMMYAPAKRTIFAEKDPYWANVVTLLQDFDLEATFDDSSSKGATCAKYGDPRQGFISPFPGYSGSIFLDSSGKDYLRYPITAFLNAPFTIEAFIFPILGSSRHILSTRTTGGTDGITLFLSADGKFSVSYSGTVLYTATVAIPTLAWTHVAVVRNGASSYSVYINGYKNGTFSNATSFASVVCDVGITKDGSAVGFFGYITNVRVSNSVIYSSDFTVPTSPLEDVAGTSLLLKAMDNGVCGSSAFKDGAIAYGEIASGRKSPYLAGGGSTYFDGVGDYLTYPSAAVPELGSGDFTAEVWVNPDELTSQGVFSKTYTVDYMWLRLRIMAGGQTSASAYSSTVEQLVYATKTSALLGSSLASTYGSLAGLSAS